MGQINYHLFLRRVWKANCVQILRKLEKDLHNLYFKFEMDHVNTQNRVFTGYDTETPTEGYTRIQFGTGTEVMSKGKQLFSVNLSLNNLFDVAYQNHLSRLKYTDVNVLTGRSGVFNMGRNFSVKVNVPLEFKVK
jgi:iron complex outermembrane receptor protein